MLYAPSFQFNLISASKLTFDNKLCLAFHCLAFHPSCCLIQDLPSKKLMGIGKVDGGLYKLIVPAFSSPPVHVNVSSTTSVITWHSRLGHLHLSCFQHLTPELSSTDCTHDKLLCEICHYAKQTRIPFPLVLLMLSLPLL